MTVQRAHPQSAWRRSVEDTLRMMDVGDSALQRRMAWDRGMRGKGRGFVGADGTAVPQLTVAALCPHGVVHTPTGSGGPCSALRLGGYSGRH